MVDFLEPLTLIYVCACVGGRNRSKGFRIVQNMFNVRKLHPQALVVRLVSFGDVSLIFDIWS